MRGIVALFGVALLTNPAIVDGQVTVATDTGAAVFQLISVDIIASARAFSGTALFTAPDGAAVTNSPVVCPAQSHPDHFRHQA